mmetsp:Transcript_10644/g.21293  ORF Transcript_10644/g.21293 Transcript_10644/m.21293 type:complete len:154 (+) Transcript_10644:209-670(+)
MSGSFLGREKFDPQLIISQMMVMQALFYLCLGFSFFLMDNFMGVPLTMDQFFSSKMFAHGLKNRWAWATVFSFVLCALGNVLFLYVVIERAKKCLDFGATVYGFHIFFCWLYAGMPSYWHWWLVIILSTTLTVLLGEYICARREMREITIVRR